MTLHARYAKIYASGIFVPFHLIENTKDSIANLSRCRTKSRVDRMQLTEELHQENDKTDRVDDS